MSVTGTAAYGMYPRNVTLSEVVYALNGAGFENEDICMVLSPAHPVATVVRDAKMLDVEEEERATSARMKTTWRSRNSARSSSRTDSWRFLQAPSSNVTSTTMPPS